MEAGPSPVGCFGNNNKPEHAQSIIMSMQQGKNETAHGYILQFEISVGEDTTL